jgi:hypothetical protein
MMPPPAARTCMPVLVGQQHINCIPVHCMQIAPTTKTDKLYVHCTDRVNAWLVQKVADK